MRKLLIIVLLIAAFPAGILGQSTNVTVNVTDTGSQAWNTGTYNFTFVGEASVKWAGGNLARSFSGNLNSSGSATVSIPDNNTINPSPSFWNLTVCPNAAITVVTCNITKITVTGSAQTVNVTPAALVIPVPNVPTIIAVVAYADAEITGGWIGFSYFNYVSQSARFCLAITNNSCSLWGSTGGGSAALAGNTNAIYLSNTCPNPSSGNCFFANANVQFCFGTHATWTGATNTATVTCDYGIFTSADVNKKMFGTTGCCQQLTEVNGTVTLPEGTISGFTNSTTVTVTFSGTSTACNTSACEFAWGTDDTANLAAAWAAVIAAPVCKALILPSGYMFTTTAQFLGGNAACPSASSTLASVYGASQAVIGSGPALSVIVPTPSFSFATCTSNITCFGGAQFMQYINWSIFGAGNGATAAPSPVSIVAFGIESYAENFMIVGWGGNDANLTAATLNGRYYHFRANGAGKTGCITSQIVYMTTSVCQYQGQLSLSVPNGTTLYSEESAYGINNTTSPSTNIAGTYNGTNDQIAGASGQANTALFISAATGVVNLVNSLVTASSTTVSNAVQISGGILRATNTTFNGANASNNTINRASGTFFDGGNNTFLTGALTTILPTCAMTTGGGTGPACSLVAGSTNEKGTVRMTPGTTPGATGTTTITFAGTFSGATNTTPNCSFTYANTGTGAWSLVNTTPIVMITRSTTVPVFNWNQTGTLTAASTYDVDYVCVAR
jgi:hypothetical protein